MDELVRVNFTDVASEEIQQIIDNLKKNFTIIQDKNEINSFVTNCSVIVANIASRNSLTESTDLVIEPLCSLIDNLMGSEKEIFKNSQQTSNK